MKKLFSCVLIVLLGCGLLISDAAAKRFGGGRSFGVQRSHHSYTKPAPKNQQHKHANQQSRLGKWGGVLGGLLIGGLLASLFMGHGLATGIISWLILGSLILFALMLFRRKLQPGYASAASSRGAPYTHGAYEPAGYSSSPEEFEAEAFLREAKVKFLRLQAAYDQKNLHDLRIFTAPEVFAEIKMQLDDRGDSANVTEVSQLDTELLDISKEADGYIASVRFSGMMTENGDRSYFSEIWHFRKFSGRNEWVVGGIQQEGSL